MMTIVLFATGIAGGGAVPPVVVAQEGNGKVTLRYDLVPMEASPRALAAGAVRAPSTGSFDDWDQQAECNSSTGATEISGTNPNGNNGSFRFLNGATVGRLSWNGNQYGWRIPNNSATAEYYNIDLTGYGSCTSVEAWACVCSKGSHAGPWIDFNSAGVTFGNVGTTWELKSNAWSGSVLNWHSNNNKVDVHRTTSSTDTLAVGFIRVYIYGAVPDPPPGPFNLTSPSNGATNRPVSGTLSWGTSSNAASYDVFLSTYDPPDELLGTVTTTHISYSGLSNGTTYYWDVVARNSIGSTDASNAPFHFTTIIPPPGNFDLSSPADGATNRPLSGTLTWGAASGATSYDVYFGTSDPPSFLRNVTSTSTAYSGSAGQAYYWYVIAKNAGGNTQCNNQFSFSTLPLPGSFNLVSPANNASNQPTSGTLTWGTSSNATSYDVYFGTSNPPSFLRNVTSTSTAYSGSAGQTYYWYVVAKNGAGNTQCNSQFSFTTAPLPGSFTLTSPSNGATNQPISGTLTWETSANATSYAVYLGTSNPPGFVDSVHTNSFGYSGLSNNSTYYWNVVAENAQGTTQSSNGPFSFTTVLPAPGPFGLLLPLNNAPNVPVSGFLTWEASSNATSYDVYWDTCSPPEFNLADVNCCSTAYSGSLGTTYYWCVFAKNGGPDSTACNLSYHYTTTLGVEEGTRRISATTELHANLPEPFRNGTEIHFSLGEETHATIRLFDRRGRLVRCFESAGSVGDHVIHWDGSDFRGQEVPAGVYFCQMTARDFTATRKVVKTE
jgi:hypothetical protein